MCFPLSDGQMIALQPCENTSQALIEMIENNQKTIRRKNQCLTATHEITAASLFNIWARSLSNGAWAVHFLNNDVKSGTVTCDVDNCFKKMGFPTSGKITIKDLWTKKQNSFNLGNPYTVTLDATGGSRTFTFIMN